MNENQNNSQNNNGYTTFTPNNYNGPVVVANAIPEKNGKYAVASLVLGILSLIFCWTIAAGFVMSIIGLIMGIISLAKKNPQKGMAIAGVILSVLALLLSVAMVVAVVVMAGAGYL
ncbi:DUF4190 domain-containing protein [Lachnospiraceae bacterium JLR.KK008]